jgi:hypothetical protein
VDPWVEDPSRLVLPRAALLLKARSGVDHRDLAGALRSRRQTIVERLPAGSVVRAGLRQRDPLGSGVDDWDAMPTADAFLEISWPADGDSLDFTSPLRGIAAALDEVDPARSAAIAGTCHLLETGDGPVALAGGARRAAGTTHEQLIDWWHHHHGPLVLSILDPKPLGYQQLHPDRAASQAVAAAAGVGGTQFDMFASSYFATVDDFVGPLAKDDVAERLRADEEGRYDHASMFGALFDML